jgi:hypothetical protein
LSTQSLSEEIISTKIYNIRGQKVMLDSDLAEMYGVSTGNLNKAVSRNHKRFPEDFMFNLSATELKDLLFQIGISKNIEYLSGRGGRRSANAFTEQGVAMLSGILNSDRAIEVNIKIFRIFTKMRQMLLSHNEIMLKFVKVEQQILKIDRRTELNEKDIMDIFDALNQLITKEESPKTARKKIGYK